MTQELTDAIVRALPVPESGNRITYDAKVKGFGCRVTAAGSRAFVLNYRLRGGRERRHTIGSFPDWGVKAARAEAKDLKRRIDIGEDPVGDLRAERAAPTVRELADRFLQEHVAKKRPATIRDYTALVNNLIVPSLGSLKVADVTFAKVDALHRRITAGGASYRANRTVAVLSKMFSLAIRWHMRTDNPAKGVERNEEAKRTRYLSGDELKRLTAALADHPDQQAANIVRLLLLTGARRGEVQAMRWEQLDLAAGVWTKPAATTKQKLEHRVPLSGPARQLLSELHEHARGDSPFVFPGRGALQHRVEIKGDWASLCRRAGIAGARIHDLRHTYASFLASAGHSLPIIGALLGHTQAQTTQRYAHLFDDPLRAATERVGAVVAGVADLGAAEVVHMPRRSGQVHRG